MRHFFKVIFFLAAMLPSISFAGFDKGREAFLREDWDVVRKEMKPLAEQRDARAQIAMGLLFAKGLGVKQNWDNAAFWFSEAIDCAKLLQGRPQQIAVRILARENYVYSLEQAFEIALFDQ
ncbi:MAG: hypothetical protein CMM57_08885 [Rhodospirillaceae bacterium]|nr:hypothetical protein [Rhodospirillaceae bacterium]